MSANKYNPLLHYNSLPLLPPQGIELEPKHILKLSASARESLAELKTAGRQIPNEGILIQTIPYLEAQSSSEIENIITTVDSIMKEASQEGNTQADAATKEAKRYQVALSHGFKRITQRPIIDHQLLVELCNTLKNIDHGFRKNSNVTIKDQTTGKVIYTPPQSGNVLREKIDNWVRFVNDSSTDLCPLVKVAVAHYQFEAIHPFLDGNGRTGRILNILMLVNDKKLDIPILYLSRYILMHKTEYYQLIQGVTENYNWIPWIEFIIQGIDQTAQWTTNKINAISRLMQHTKIYLKRHDQQRKNPKIYSHELINLIFEHAYCQIQDLTDKGIAKRQTASKYLKTLVDLGILVQIKHGKQKLFVHTKLSKLLMSASNEFTPYPTPGLAHKST